MPTMLTVKDIMCRSPRTLSIRATIAEAKKLMNRLGVRHLPVIENAQPVAIVSDRDIKFAAAVYKQRNFDQEITIDRICVFEPYIVQEDTPLDQVLSQMARKRIGSALVVKKDKLSGILTTIDICKAFAALLKEKK